MNDLTFSERVPQTLIGQLDAGREPLDLLEYWRSIARHKWSILALTLLVGVLAALVSLAIRPVYRSTATVLIEQGRAKVVSIEEVYNNPGANREYFQTQVEVLKSRDLARKIVLKLNLTKHPDFDPRQSEGASRKTWLPADLFEAKAPQDEEEILKQVQTQLMNELQVVPVRNSQLVQISFTAHDKELAAKVPNTLADLYVESDLEAKVQMTQKANAWLTERMGDLRKKLEDSERSLQEYRERERIVDAKGVALSGASRGLEEAMSSLVAARAKRAEAESLYNQVQSAGRQGRAVNLDSLPAVLRHPLVQKLREQEAEAERKLSDASKRYGAEHPKMIQAIAEASTAREATKRQVESVVAGISREFEVARANEQAIERALGQSKSEIQSLNRKEFQLGVLEREATQNRQLYDMFLSRFKETNVSGSLQSTIARLIDPATVQSIPYAPKKTRIVVAAAAVALLFGVLLALLLERLNNTLNATADVERRLKLPVLGYLQKVKGFMKKGFKSELAFFNDSQSVFAESIRTIRTSVLMTALDSPHKVLVITSSVPEEGKTTVSFNLACALAQVKKVLLIDADLRRPKIGKLLSRETGAPGLSNLVAGTAQPSQCIFHDQRTGLHVMTAGEVPPNPLELLSSRRFHDVVEKLREAFDIIVIDTAPLQLVSDALVLSQLANSIIYVVKADSTPYQLAQNGIKRLRQVNAPLAGVVLNQLDLEKAEKYYGEYATYGSYKGYQYGSGSQKK
jgi:succinoglycan biosynthesis transport protein ExoP